MGDIGSLGNENDIGGLYLSEGPSHFRLLMLPAIHDVSSSRVGMNTSLVAPLGDEMFLAIPRVSRVRQLIVNPFFYCLCYVDCPFMEDRLLRDTPKKRLDAYKRGAVLRDGAVRIVRWGFMSVVFPYPHANAAARYCLEGWIPLRPTPNPTPQPPTLSSRAEDTWNDVGLVN